MPRLLIHVEGETEEAFVNEMLRAHLISVGYESVGARIVGNARQRDRRGGIRPWPDVKRDIVRHLNQDPGCLSTTMIDYYALPKTGSKAWPGRAAAGKKQFPEKAPTVHAALAADMSGEFRGAKDRFIPFVMMHEFEALLFSDCAAFANAIGRPALEGALQEVRDEFDCPEEINDSPLTAPSKRVEKLVKGYQKPIYGTIAALGVGLPAIRAACPNFDAWICDLESR